MFEAFAVVGVFASVAIASVAGHYISTRASQRRIELLHQERLAAIEKGIPLPELPLDPPSASHHRPPNGHGPLLTGIVLLFGGVGAMVGFLISHSDGLHEIWSVPLPLALVGVGLILYHFLTFLSRRRD